jgi:UDP-glucose 4-epimerase
MERAHGIRFVALRYFNAAGAHPDGTIGEDHDPEIHLIPRAIQAATGGAPLKVFGEDYPTPDGTCLRDYIHVCDLADAHVRALDALSGGAASAVYNVGTGTPHSVRAVIETVSRVVGQPVRWEPGARRPGDPAALFASSARIQQALGWRPRYADLDAIVQHAWRWHAAHPRGYEDPRRT